MCDDDGTTRRRTSRFFSRLWALQHGGGGALDGEEDPLPFLVHHNEI